MPLIDNAVINKIRLAEQSTAPSAPASGYLYLYALATGLYFQDAAGVERRVGLQVSTADVSNPPTNTELSAIFGTPAAVGAGFTALVDDGGGGTYVYLVYSTGSVWVYTLLTVAV